MSINTRNLIKLGALIAAAELSGTHGFTPKMTKTVSKPLRTLIPDAEHKTGVLAIGLSRNRGRSG